MSVDVGSAVTLASRSRVDGAEPANTRDMQAYREAPGHIGEPGEQ